MNRQRIALSVAMAAIIMGGIALAEGTRTEEREEYVPTAETTTILREELAAIDGKEGTVFSGRLKPGWVGERHYHTGDVFVYVVKGSFTVDVDGEERKTFGPGEVYHEAVNKVMQARNLSTKDFTEVVIFQVGDKGEPLMIRAQ